MMANLKNLTLGIPQSIEDAVNTLADFAPECAGCIMHVSELEFTLKAYDEVHNLIEEAWHLYWTPGSSFPEWPQNVAPALIAEFHSLGLYDPFCMVGLILSYYYRKANGIEIDIHHLARRFNTIAELYRKTDSYTSKN